MKNGKTHLFKTLTIATMLLLASRSHALFTPYLSGVSNDIALYATTLTDPSDKAEARVVARVLKDLSKPSTSVAGDYNLFLRAALHLGPFVLKPPFGEVGSNAFLFFMSQAQTNLLVTAARIGALNDFIPTKKAASNQLVRAAATLGSVATAPDAQRALLLGSQVFARLAAANRLAAIGEAHPGFALDSLVGKLLEHHERGQSGTVHFDNATTVTETDSEGTSTSAYTYTRTGLNSATLVLTHDEGGGLTSTTTVKIRFAATTRGTFTFRNQDSDGSVNIGAGTFTLN